MTRSYLLHNMAAVRAAYPELEEHDVDLQACGVELADDNTLLAFEGFAELPDGRSTDIAYDVADIPEASCRALVALALVHGDPCAS
jgi:hypothetical protein